jgi:hypothetical protein
MRRPIAGLRGAAPVALALLLTVVPFTPRPGAAFPATAAAQTAPVQRVALVIEGAGGAHRFDIEVAHTPAARARGLMFREALAADSGMIFLFGIARPVAMWMKNTLIPLDMLFIDRDWRILRIAERTTPYSEEAIPSGGPVIAVLELAGGTARRLGLAPGDRVRMAGMPGPE